MKNFTKWTMGLAIVLTSTVITTQSAHAQTFTNLFNFDGTDGSRPNGLVQAANGDFYGTTNTGGASSYCWEGCGTVYQITPSGSLTRVHSFCDATNAAGYCTDGNGPTSALIQAINGDLYGTTPSGGAYGEGTVFKIAPSGTLTTLYSFCALGQYPNCLDGISPSNLVQATNGALYGTTPGGGANGRGTVFKITLDGTLTTLYNFCSQFGCTDGAGPAAGLIQATEGNFYGTTSTGGGGGGFGTVFKITPSGTLTTLYSFCTSYYEANCPNGGVNPSGGLIQATNGKFYGTTQYSNLDPGRGSVFEITSSGMLTTLYTFCTATDGNNCTDGENPTTGLIQATNGDLYGITFWGGANNNGMVFQITPGGALTTLYSFSDAGGDAPNAALIQATNGNFYGTGNGLPDYGEGTVFSLSVGLGPFVETQTTSGKMGASVRILGTDLAGATSVTFNGTPATFTVNSTGSAISATVPTGATTGTLTVTTPGGVLSSNKPFTVRE